ncbi:MAG TPA: hypothetical protein VIJ35_28475, partial [Bradyrhizobium sp.]
PPSVDEWLPERHLARFVVEVVERGALSPANAARAGHLKLTRLGGAVQAFTGGLTDEQDTSAVFG